MKFIRTIATGRHAIKDEAYNRKPMRKWGNSREEIDLLGVLGEFTVAKVLKLPFDASLSLEGDGGTDLMLGKYNIQVKTTKYRTGRLIFNSEKEMLADIYVLCFAEPELAEVTILGYIRHASLPDCLIEMDLGHGKRLVVEQKHLKPISLIIAYIDTMSI